MPITSHFGPHSTALEVVHDHDLTGSRAVVTGGASGIGVETVRALVSAGAQVTIAARNAGAMASLADALAAEGLKGSVETLEIDLGSLASVKDAAASYLSRDEPLELLINNAGVMATPFGHTSDGFELQFGTNHLGHFAFTTALLPALRRAQGARVVALSSIGHRRSPFVPDDPNFERRAYDRWSAYGQSKTANALFAVELTHRCSAEGVFANAVMPGGIQTGLQKHLSREEQFELGWIDEQGTPNPRFKSPAQGASTSIWAAVGPELHGLGGRYLENCAEALPWDASTPNEGCMPYALDAEMAKRLWDISERLLAQV
jgi:NAD(P)-dependent dehydrogenase (short-subunit alcohol dehydrogenase family)